METITVDKLDKEFKVEILKGKPRHSDIKKLLKSDFNFIKGVCEVYILEWRQKTLDCIAKVLLTDGSIINVILYIGRGKNLVNEINTSVLMAMRTKYNSGSFFISEDMTFEKFKDSYVDKVSATLPIISKELEVRMKRIKSEITTDDHFYRFIAKIA